MTAIAIILYVLGAVLMYGFLNQAERVAGLEVNQVTTKPLVVVFWPAAVFVATVNAVIEIARGL